MPRSVRSARNDFARIYTDDERVIAQVRGARPLTSDAYNGLARTNDAYIRQ